MKISTTKQFGNPENSQSHFQNFHRKFFPEKKMCSISTFFGNAESETFC